MAMENVNTVVNETIEAEVISDENGNVTADATQSAEPVENKNARMTVTTVEEANDVLAIAGGFGVKGSVSAEIVDNKPVVVVTLEDVSDEQLDKISRRCNIKQWSDAVTGAANKVSNFVSDTADFALNGAVVPAATSVYAAGAKIAGVGSKAVVRTAASVVNTTLVEATQAVLEIATDKTVNETVSTIKTVGKMIGNKLFGASGNTKFQRC